MLGGIIITNSASRNIAKCAVSQAARLVSKGSTAALVPQTGQGFATHSGKYPIQPYSKKRVKAKSASKNPKKLVFAIFSLDIVVFLPCRV